MTSHETGDFDASDWAWAIEAIIEELARLGPRRSAEFAAYLAARIGYVEADPIDTRQRLKARLAARLCQAAFNEAA